LFLPNATRQILDRRISPCLTPPPTFTLIFILIFYLGLSLLFCHIIIHFSFPFSQATLHYTQLVASFNDHETHNLLIPNHLLVPVFHTSCHLHLQCALADVISLTFPVMIALPSHRSYSALFSPTSWLPSTTSLPLISGNFFIFLFLLHLILPTFLNLVLFILFDFRTPSTFPHLRWHGVLAHSLPFCNCQTSIFFNKLMMTGNIFYGERFG
jgi:hypothetical protein